MDIQELRDKKLALEKRLFDIISDELDDFREETGIHIVSVDIEMFDTTTRRELLLGQGSSVMTGVRCNLAI